MITCPYCQHKMPEGTLFCEECGLSLWGDANTHQIDTELDSLSEGAGGAGWGTATFGPNHELILQISGSTDSLAFKPETEFYLGRQDPNAETQVHLELTPFGGLEKGVSRRHAMLRRGDDVLQIVDLGSSNGTFLNGQRVVRDHPRLVRDGDEIQLGQLVIRIFFRPV